LGRRFALAFCNRVSSLPRRSSEARQQHGCHRNCGQACSIKRGTTLYTTLAIVVRISTNPERQTTEVGDSAHGTQCISCSNKKQKITSATAITFDFCEARRKSGIGIREQRNSKCIHIACRLRCARTTRHKCFKSEHYLVRRLFLEGNDLDLVSP